MNLEDIKEGMMFQNFQGNPYLIVKVHADKTVDLMFIYRAAPAHIQERRVLINVGRVVTDLRSSDNHRIA